MINKPNKGTELNIGVEDGSDAVITAKFLENFTGAAVTEYHFAQPEEIQKDDYLGIIARQSKELAETINSSLGADEIQVVVGGDHSVAMGSLLAVLTRLNPATVGYIQVDSHGDIHLLKTSPSGNFHGMWLRPFLGEFDSPEIAKVITAGLKPEQIMFIGNLDLESEERQVLESKKILTINSGDLAGEKSQSLKKLENFVAKFEHIHIGFDVDVFNRELVSATGIPADHGLPANDVMEVLNVLSGVKPKSIDLVEVNPRKPGIEATTELAQRVLLKLIGARA